MKNKFLKMAFAGLVLSVSGFANAGLIITNFNTTLGLVSGSDSAGLNGANVNIYAEFDDTSIYVNLFGFPSVNALLHSITISSASVSGSNGTYSDPDGLTYYPTFFNSFESNVGNFLTAGPLVRVLMETGPGSVIPSMGDTISTNHFNTTIFHPRVVDYQGVDRSIYSWTQNSFTVSTTQTPVPEPSTLAILGLGLMGLAVRRFKKQA